MADGDIYEGEWKEGQMSGSGVYTYGKSSARAGDKYSGQFKNNKFNGKGWLIN